MSLALASRERGDKIEHRWRMQMHLDGCHHYQSVYACLDCGAALHTYDERDVNEDPWSLMWMSEDGEGKCARCHALMGGDEPAHEMTYYPKGAQSDGH